MVGGAESMLQSGQCAERERIEHNLRAGHLLMLTYDMETLLFENIGSFVIGLNYLVQPTTVFGATLHSQSV